MWPAVIAYCAAARSTPVIRLPSAHLHVHTLKTGLEDQSKAPDRNGGLVNLLEMCAQSSVLSTACLPHWLMNHKRHTCKTCHVHRRCYATADAAECHWHLAARVFAHSFPCWCVCISLLMHTQTVAVADWSHCWCRFFSWPVQIHVIAGAGGGDMSQCRHLQASGQAETHCSHQRIGVGRVGDSLSGGMMTDRSQGA